MIDIDHMQAINRDHGHLVGDQVLREVAQRIQQILRKDDVLARYGGNTLAALLVESDFEATVEVAERCREGVGGQPVLTTVGPIGATVSLGVAAPAAADLGTPDELLTEAEERLQEAKRGGRNCVVC
jgi:diguanylate cyclase (GGDEF)-like protein